MIYFIFKIVSSLLLNLSSYPRVSRRHPSVYNKRVLLLLMNILSVLSWDSLWSSKQRGGVLASPQHTIESIVQACWPFPLLALLSHSAGVMQGTGWLITGQAYLEPGYLHGVPPELLEFVEWGCVIGNACSAATCSQRGRVWRCLAGPRSFLRLLLQGCKSSIVPFGLQAHQALIWWLVSLR